MKLCSLHVERNLGPLIDFHKSVANCFSIKGGGYFFRRNGSSFMVGSSNRIYRAKSTYVDLVESTVDRRDMDRPLLLLCQQRQQKKLKETEIKATLTIEFTCYVFPL